MNRLPGARGWFEEVAKWDWECVSPLGVLILAAPGGCGLRRDRVGGSVVMASRLMSPVHNFRFT